MNPGSPQAVELGCTCAVLDNYHGQGFPLTRDGMTRQSFWISGDCPLHAIEPVDTALREAHHDPED